MSSFSVSSIIEKCKNDDPDLRSMAMIDFQQELQKDNVTLDDSSQVQLSDMVLTLLEDETSRVRGAASECLKHFVKRMTQSLIESTIKKLAHNVFHGEEEKREFSSNALKTIIAQMPSHNADGPIHVVVEPLFDGAQNEKVDLQQDALEFLNDLLGRFGPSLKPWHSKLQNICLERLSSQYRSIRKRCVKALSNLSIHSDDKLFGQLMDKVLKEIEADSDRTYVQLTSSVAKKAGHRLGSYLSKIITLMMDTAEKISEEEGEDEIREHILEAFELFVLKCPEEVKPYIDLIVILSKEYIEYDPNYSYDTSDEDEMEDEEDMDFDDEEMDDGEYSDDDDISWKVRKAAAKCLISIIKTRPSHLSNLYNELLEDEDFDLTSRFKEREDSVKLQIFEVLKTLLAQSVTVTTTSDGVQHVHPKVEASFVKNKKHIIIKRLKRQLSTKNSKIKLGVFQVFNSLTHTLQGELSDVVPTLFKSIQTTLKQATDQDIQLKLEVLLFLRSLLENEKSESFTSIFEEMTKVVYQTIDDKYYKIIAEALRVCQVNVHVLKAHQSSGFFSEQVQILFRNINNKLQIQDIDQDVKDASIAAMGTFIAHLGKDSPNLTDEIKNCLTTLVDRLKNEITRLGTCRALNEIAESGYDISNILDEVLVELSNYLRKFNRSLRQAALMCLRTMILSYHNQIDAKRYEQMLDESSSLLTETDLNLAHLSLQLSTAILTNATMSKNVKKVILPKALALLESNTLQGSALDSLVEFLKAISKEVGFSTLLKKVLETVRPNIVKQVYTNLGRIIAALVENASSSEKQSTIKRFLTDLKSNNVSTRILAFFTLGEIGRYTDLTSYGDIEGDIQQCFKSESEEVQNAASYCLGNVAIGNLEKFLPSITEKIKSNKDERYLLMHALKNIIVQADNDRLKHYAGEILPILFNNTNNEEEGIRNVVSECLGKMTIADYDGVMKELKSLISEDDELKKSTTISAVKFAITERGNTFDQKLKADLEAFLALLTKKESVPVRKACVLLLTSAARNNTSLIDDKLDQYLPNLYEECVFDKSLVKVVDLGPFKHKVDGGIEIRKSAFECMDTILNNLHNRVDPTKFVSQLPNGVKDGDNDINMLTYHIITKCTELFPRELLLIIDQITQPMTKLLKKKLGEKALSQQKERLEELQRTALRTVAALSTVPGVNDKQSFVELKKKAIEGSTTLSQWYSDIANEGAESVPMDLSQ